MNIEDTEVIETGCPSVGKGYVHVYTGDGKGKTTAAMGLALRAAGAGLRVFIAQFIKSGRYSEINYLKKCAGDIVARQYGSGCWLRGKPSPEDVRLAGNGLEEVRRIIREGEYQVVILDEACVAAWFGVLQVDDLLDLIDNKPPGVELIFTGRKADPRLIEKADLVTEMREIKHYYRQGVEARKGIES
ncbi:MAG TPA: cob(I)yrinic acid a,c-diamide adenosyltransferase [Candidatus Aminicenantes bacterium]|nr:cob(I)yrinic acid a,c-diamide adenosyltransferase [Candidatus Aminicenantes bacterium]